MPFELWRQDDNGNRFLIAVYLDRSAAEQRLAELTSNQHKQIYWISESCSKSLANTQQNS